MEGALQRPKLALVTDSEEQFWRAQAMPHNVVSGMLGVLGCQ